ncbi:MAG: 6-oxocyclohex-1-ene-1-carbonyl-CoA hydratase [candidate division Zixibacteria bacterium]|nr:6-oxocyclohex-1-ene-1-carbonyl-CoA hydratase [candidate division Zixibacteria bacterium]MBU1470046.1 6-oxocyclohex-1-ene-1-carbonyl-CoA hydratase [candidate division Zixibacteria bacterium]MBU2624366.1 6-oxocyclohex-1-ene-1-carbonyl-CoA hydratase [candidate division Zixibacteria bacterium]
MGMNIVSHDLVDVEFKEIIYELRPCLDLNGDPVDGLNNAWISLNNPKQYNSYTTAAVKEVILAFRKASNDRSVVAVVFTAVGDKAFCTGGNTKEYAEYYSGRPLEYKQYMRLFNDMITSILMCDKPVICRVNGMRVAGGQEIGMACDFTIASDLAVFGQAGPRHGSAPEGGSTDFLHLFVGIERAMQSCTLCEMWTAYEAQNYGLITKAVPVLKVDDKFVRNPLVITDQWLDDSGEIVYGRTKSGDEMKAGKETLKGGTIDLSPLDKLVDSLCTKMMYLMPDCINKTLNSLRKKKLEHWDRNQQSNRDWLGLNMMTEAKAGFRAFNEGPKGNREVDFIKLRKMLSEGHPWDEELLDAILPR